MLSKSNKYRLLTLGTVAMCMLVVGLALGACSSAPSDNTATIAETQSETEAEDKAASDAQDSVKADETEATEATDEQADKSNEASDDKEEAKAAETDEKATGAEEKTSKKADATADDKAPETDNDEAEVSDTASAAATTTASMDASWGEGLDCKTCHTKVADTLENSDCLVSQHTALDCTTCHADAALSDVHATVTADDRMPSSLRASAVDTAVCQTCHNPETLVEATADSTILTDENGTVVNPHELPEVAEHAEVTCVSCHKMHSKTGIEKSASRACQSCHHTNVYECGTCHAA